jgi:hypothetical protein
MYTEAMECGCKSLGCYRVCLSKRETQIDSLLANLKSLGVPSDRA